LALLVSSPHIQLHSVYRSAVTSGRTGMKLGTRKTRVLMSLHEPKPVHTAIDNTL